jgi:hypothetical protein
MVRKKVEVNQEQRRAAARAPEDPLTGPAVQGAGAAFARYGHPGYSERHEQVFLALVKAQTQHGGDAVYLDVIARTADLPREETRRLLYDLVAVYRLASELPGTDDADLGPRFEPAPGR